MQVRKFDGTIVPFDTRPVRGWVQYAVNGLKDRISMEYHILTETLKRLPEGIVSSEEIHQTMIKVCLDEEDITYSRVAAKLEMASIYKNQERILGIYKPELVSFFTILEVMETEGLWSGSWLEDSEIYSKESTINEWLIELEAQSLEFWTVKQWSDKYSLKKNGEAIETPAQGCLAIALAYHGVCDLAFEVAKDLLHYRLNLPTPALNGVRNGNYNSISCCVIEGGDTVESLDVAEYIASSMTAKKAGIGLTLDTRSKGDPVKGGAVKHLGKAPLYRSIESSVKKYTQESRGGSATMTMKCIDPDIEEMLLWKTQRIDLSQRIDKIDYSFAYNDSFVEAALKDEDWYLFSKSIAPELHKNFDSPNYEQYLRAELRKGTPHKKVKALDILKKFLSSRWETGRIYCVNLSVANKHTPFIDKIKLSNLCQEIMLPTHPYPSMEDLISETSQGETAFCSLAALNVSNIEKEEYFEVAERALRTVHKMIEKAPMMSNSMRESLLSRNSVGIGITGLASAIYKEGLDYDGSEESIEFVESTAELHYYSLLKASQKMAAELDTRVEGIDESWLPIDTMCSAREPSLDWERLRGKPRLHSVLVAHMPTESSAVFSNATNGLYPSRDRVVLKKARKGKIQFISEFFVNKTPAWQVDMVPYYSAVQGYTDQAISADYYTDFTKYEGKKVPQVDLLKWFFSQAYAGIKTAYYQNFKEIEGKEVEQEDTCEGGCKL